MSEYTDAEIRAQALREAAAFYEAARERALTQSDPRYWTAVRDIVLGLRHRANEEALGLEVRR
jgi:hypothetical protein